MKDWKNLLRQENRYSLRRRKKPVDDGGKRKKRVGKIELCLVLTRKGEAT